MSYRYPQIHRRDKASCPSTSLVGQKIYLRNKILTPTYPILFAVEQQQIGLEILALFDCLGPFKWLGAEVITRALHIHPRSIGAVVAQS